ncbi:MAG: DUF4239 domain-containing protein [Acidobacteriota bacterium]|nr:DUF4239 domain-containing protein [Acidobacteriota bacterium]
MNYPPAIALLLLPAMLVLVAVGRRLRRRDGSVAESSSIEAAVFALFGLLLAFTFSGAAGRYDTHRQLVVEEGNDIGTAYLRLDLLPRAAQPELRELFRRYTDSRLHLYDSVALEVSPETAALQHEIWMRCVAASAAPGAGPDAAKLLLPALNAMIDITSTRQNSFSMHPPPVVFFLLFGLSCGAAILAGYGMTSSGRSWFYMVALALTVTATVYATLEIEYPRQGLIRLRGTDKILVGVRDSMK